ncbi:hypothetical protein LMG28614_06909 [Paraburkholderia ultramafica]|uniref:Uncharacterized protein n=2 Tax=Paraburkholderia ultramafica TaxID=1544867 RepID=A0A6S7CG78_9BURK|nr:hypothetical protein LMG28614_06909 [Paraburkholderia ultramafica]
MVAKNDVYRVDQQDNIFRNANVNGVIVHGALRH